MEKLGWHSLGTSFKCTCGEVHRLPTEVCHVGSDAAQQMAAFAEKRCGRTVMAVSDENTRQAAGDAPVNALIARGKEISEKVYGAKPFEATLELAEEVAILGAEADFYVAIGSGTVCDLAKYAGDKQKKPVLLFATAASMNGYTSGIVALKVRGLKRTQPCMPALGVFADPAVVATAPQRMLAAGVGDFLSKASSSTDWRAAHLVRGDYFCERPREFFEGVQEKLLAAAPAVGRAEHSAVAAVLDALLLSGLSMVVAGSSAPASGGEHLLSHYLDMKHSLYGTPNDLHGTQVGVGTVHCLGLWERVLALDPAKMDIEALLDAQPPEDAIDASIVEDWGPVVSQEVRAQWTQKRLDRDALRKELLHVRGLLPKLRDELTKDLLPSKVVADAIRAAGGPVEPEGLEAPPEEFRKAVKTARYIRNRFTILDLAAELCIG